MLLRFLLLCLVLANEPFSDSPNLKPPPPEPAPIVVGAVFNLSGAQADLDGPALQGAMLAVDEVNRNGGIHDHRVKLMVVDGHSDAAELQRRTRDLLDSQKPVALLGLSDSDMVLACAPLAAERQVPFVTSGATSPRLPLQIKRDLYLAAFGDNAQAAAAAEFAWGRGWKTAAVFSEDDMEYARLLRGYFETAYREGGGQIVELASHPEVVFVACGPQQVRQRLTQLRAQGYSGPILGGDSFDGPELGSDEQIWFTSHAFLPQHPRFVAEYLKLYPLSQPTAFSALGYDAAQLVLEALSKSRSLDAEGVTDALDLVRNFSGVSGDFHYTYRDRVPQKTVFVLQNPDRKLAAELVPERVPAP